MLKANSLHLQKGKASKTESNVMLNSRGECSLRQPEFTMTSPIASAGSLGDQELEGSSN